MIAAPKDHREGVGGLWEEIGKLQFDFLVSRGLLPQSTLLDVGCGSLRGGIHFVRYLQEGHYWGIEKEEALLKAGREIELPNAELGNKRPHLHLIDDFDLTKLPGRPSFDFVLAQSVFTHLEPQLIKKCLVGVMPWLKSSGTFYATYRESEEVERGKPHRWRRDERRGAHYPFAFFSFLADTLGIRAERVGEWGHPRRQLMLAFRHP